MSGPTPPEQTTPAAWANLNFAQLKTQVHDYTASTLNSFKAAGVPLDMVQLGNETTAGMLWPQGQLNFAGTTADLNASWANYGQLLNSAITAVREAQPPGQHTNIALVGGAGGEWYGTSQGGGNRWFYDNLMQHGAVTDFDTLGIDDYPPTATELSNFKNNLTDLATRYNKKVLVGETSFPWKAVTNYDATAPYPLTPQGQADYLTDLSNYVYNLPNNAGEGILWWYPEATPVHNTFVYKGGGMGLFDATGKALPAINALSVPEPALLPVLLLAIPFLLSRRQHA